MPYYFLPIVFLLIVLYFTLRRQRLLIAARAAKRKTKEERSEMVELAKRFIGKDCLIYAFDSGHQFSGVVTEVTEHAVLIEKDGLQEAINLDFVIRIREYPRNKKGKKKSVILD